MHSAYCVESTEQASEPLVSRPNIFSFASVLRKCEFLTFSISLFEYNYIFPLPCTWFCFIPCHKLLCTHFSSRCESYVLHSLVKNAKPKLLMCFLCGRMFA